MIFETFRVNRILHSLHHIPSHVAVILDGNRRYAAQHGLSTVEGHRKGAEVAFNFARWARDIGVTHLSLFAFSTENFQRSDDEKKGLKEIFLENFIRLAEDSRIVEYQVHISFIGDRKLISPDLLEAIEALEKKTRLFSRYHVNIAIAYGGRHEIATVAANLSGCIVTPEVMTKELYQNSNTPKLDLLIRSAGESRVSNFLPWLSFGTECVFCCICRNWPEIRRYDLVKALKEYSDTFQE
ncbi:MAG TPA: polyprenyl diphosphate synthase [Methanocorpusculum sp.]|nr:polyprenyl diphosphate synthase [Methanocorpusculum sp.]